MSEPVQTRRLRAVKTVEGMRALARRRLPRGIFEFVDRGSEQETALVNMRTAYDRIRMRPRVLVDVSQRSTVGTIVGHSHAMPAAVAPMGAAGLVWFKGEVALARAAAAAKVPFTLATRAMSSIETIAAQAGGTLWFQLYASGNKAMSFDLIDRAMAAGYQALVVTVDTPVSPRRDYNDANGFSLPFKPSGRAALDVVRHPWWLASVLGRYLVNGGIPRFENMPGRLRITDGPPASAMHDGTLEWQYLQELRRRWRGKFIVKGVLHAKDAIGAVERGADAVVVSSHGGRNLDSAVAPIDVLAEVVAAVGTRAEVLVDGGIRRGSDIAKALALGATGVLIGRPAMYGVAVAGQAGAEHVLKILKDELSYTMAMLGCPRIEDLGPEILHLASIDTTYECGDSSRRQAAQP